MISIKVCSLSDLNNKAMTVLLTTVCIFVVYNLLIKSINNFSEDFIIFSIENKLVIKRADEVIENLILSKLPVNLLNSDDDIEKEFNIADNRIVNDSLSKSKDSNIANSDNNIANSNNNSSKIQNTQIIKLTSPYLLACEKVSNSKYKIGSTTINNYTKKELNLDELEKSLFAKIDKNCKVLIYHTHTSESYSGIENYSDSYRTEDENCNVVKVGESLKEELNKYGIYVRHDTTVHDYPSYNGAYKSSLNTVENILKNENYDIIIDIHRDALASNSQYRPTAEISGETVAKLMFVVGTNAAGLKHDNWVENLKFALLVQERSNEIFPGLFRDMHLSTSRYNQHTSDKTIILEVGATGNTIEEACASMKYFAKLINSIKENDK